MRKLLYGRLPCNPELHLYVQGEWEHTSRRHIDELLYGGQTGRHRHEVRIFGSLRACAAVFTGDRCSRCPACASVDSSTCHALGRCRSCKYVRRWLGRLFREGLGLATIASNALFLRLVFGPWHESHVGRGDAIRSVRFVAASVAEARAAAARRA